MEKGREWKRTDRGRMTAEGSNKDKEEQERGSTERKEQVRAYVRDRAAESGSVGGAGSVRGEQSACNNVWECIWDSLPAWAYGTDRSEHSQAGAGKGERCHEKQEILEKCNKKIGRKRETKLK